MALFGFIPSIDEQMAVRQMRMQAGYGRPPAGGYDWRKEYSSASQPLLAQAQRGAQQLGTQALAAQPRNQGAALRNVAPAQADLMSQANMQAAGIRQGEAQNARNTLLALRQANEERQKEFIGSALNTAGTLVGGAFGGPAGAAAGGAAGGIVTSGGQRAGLGSAAASTAPRMLQQRPTFFAQDQLPPEAVSTLGPPGAQFSYQPQGAPGPYGPEWLGQYLLSDERAKEQARQEGAADAIRQFLGSMPAQTFQYRGDPSGQRQVGVMAQDVAQTPIGQQMVRPTPQGLAIDPARAVGPTLAALNALEARIAQLEGGRRRTSARRRAREQYDFPGTQYSSPADVQSANRDAADLQFARQMAAEYDRPAVRQPAFPGGSATPAEAQARAEAEIARARAQYGSATPEEAAAGANAEIAREQARQSVLQGLSAPRGAPAVTPVTHADMVQQNQAAQVEALRRQHLLNLEQIGNRLAPLAPPHDPAPVQQLPFLLRAGLRDVRRVANTPSRTPRPRAAPLRRQRGGY